MRTKLLRISLTGVISDCTSAKLVLLHAKRWATHCFLFPQHVTDEFSVCFNQVHEGLTDFSIVLLRILRCRQPPDDSTPCAHDEENLEKAVSGVVFRVRSIQKLAQMFDRICRVRNHEFRALFGVGEVDVTVWIFTGWAAAWVEDGEEFIGEG